MGKNYVLVEGHGEVAAVGNLLSRVSRALGSPAIWAPALRWKNLHRKDALARGANLVRSRADAEALLVLRDEDDACPKERGPEMAAWLRGLGLPFPAALVLLHPEYEVLFLPCLEQMAGRPLGKGPAARVGLQMGTRWEGDWERHRGIKEWLTAHFPPNRAYKPTLDQLPLTQMIDLPTLRDAQVPCFGTLERALTFLLHEAGQSGVVYP